MLHFLQTKWFSQFSQKGFSISPKKSIPSKGILQISNFKNKTLSRIQSSLDYDGIDGAYLSGIYADMNYQRKIRLKKLVNKLLFFEDSDKVKVTWLYVYVKLQLDDREIVEDFLICFDS